MGIAKLGESLLGDIRKRNEEEAKRQEKIARNTALGKLAIKGGLAIGNQLLEEQANNFFQNEQMLAATATQNKALTNAQQLMSIQKQAEAQGMSVKDYKFSQVRPVFEARLKENYKARIGVNEAGEAAGFDAFVTQEAMKYVDQWDKDYSEALSLANEIGTQQDFNKMLQLNAKKVVSSDVGSWVTKNFIRMFSGKSSDDVQREAVLAIADSDMAKNAEKLNLFMDEFNRTNNVNEAKTFADSAFPDKMIEGEDILTVNQKILNVGNKAFIVIEEVRENTVTGKKTISYGKTDEGVLKVTPLNPQNVEEVDQALTKNLVSTFDFSSNANDELTPEAYSAFARKARDANILVNAPKNTKEYYKLSEIYSEFITDSTNLKDPARESRVLAMQEILLGDGLELKSFLAQMTENPEEREKILQDLILRLSDITKKARSLVEDSNSIDLSQIPGG